MHVFFCLSTCFLTFRFFSYHHHNHYNHCDDHDHHFFYFFFNPIVTPALLSFIMHFKHFSVTFGNRFFFLGKFSASFFSSLLLPSFRNLRLFLYIFRFSSSLSSLIYDSSSQSLSSSSSSFSFHVAFLVGMSSLPFIIAPCIHHLSHRLFKVIYSFSSFISRLLFFHCHHQHHHFLIHSLFFIIFVCSFTF